MCDGRIYAFGGKDIPSLLVYAMLQRFDPATGLWELLPPAPAAVHGVASARVGGTLWFFGGAARAASGAGSDLIQRFACSEEPLVSIAR